MPLRQPASPLVLETCPQPAPDLDDNGLLGSDDDLDQSQRSAKRRRIEKLAETYLEGTPLFILTASLRGPLDGGWVNPWKKNRRKATGNRSDGERAEQPVIPETSSRKRRLYRSPPAPSSSRLSATPIPLPRSDHFREVSLSTRRKSQLAVSRTAETDTHSPRSARFKAADGGWLKKDNVSTRFQNIDPPTSPTTSISSRRGKAKDRATKVQSLREPVLTEFEPDELQKTCRPKQPSQDKPSLQARSGANPASSTEGRQTPKPCALSGDSQPVNDDESLRVVSSSSQLPKFEYRLKKRSASIAKADRRIHPRTHEDGSSEVAAAGRSAAPSNRPVDGSHHSRLKRSARASQAEISDPHVPQDSLTLTEASYTVPSPSSPRLGKRAVSNSKDHTSDNIPSAQHTHGNPLIPDNLISLYSIAVSKGTSDHTEVHNPDPQFSTQAALLMAQRSFQNDLRSPEKDLLMSGTKRRVSQNLNDCSPNPVNITPFHQINTHDWAVDNRDNAPGTAGMQMVSTQYMMDAATPFAFSTEKKAGTSLLSIERERSKTKKRKATSFALSSPSEIPVEQSQLDQDKVENVLQQQPGDVQNPATESLQSVLPMTLTGTTPPTAQDYQGAESFNLSQAIAEAGSWLQQSFDLTKDITQCRNTKLSQSYSTVSTPNPQISIDSLFTG